jgi:ribonuclease HIII
LLLKTYEDIKKILNPHNIVIHDYELINYGLQFNISTSNWSGKLRIYQSKKTGLKVDYSLLSRDNASEIRNLIEGKNINTVSNNLQNEELGYPIIGTDESGKGDYFGPLVIAGVYLDEATAKKLVTYGIRDSKKLSDSRNLELAQIIKEVCKGDFVIIEISPERYNKLYEQFRKEGKNLNVMLAWGHAKAIEELLTNVDCQLAIIDQFADEKVVLQKLQQRGRKLNLIQRHKAEENLAVAAASILARARFLERLSALSKLHNIKIPKGASEEVIKCAEEFIKKYGITSLPKIAKIHFKITDKLLNEASQ